MDKVCVCFGGGNISVDFELCEKLKGAILQSINEGFKTFFCSGYGNFSLLFAAILRNCQQSGKDIRVVCYIPDLPNSNQYRSELFGLNLYDEVYILPSKNMIETDLFLIKKGQRIIVSKKMRNKEQTALTDDNSTQKRPSFYITALLLFSRQVLHPYFSVFLKK